jgi:hypothetical protein
MGLEGTPTTTVAVLGGNTIVGEVRFVTEELFDDPRSFDGVQLLIFAPGLDPERRKAIVELITNASLQLSIPILELVGNTRAQRAGVGRYMLWPCRPDDLKRQVKTALLANTGSSQNGRAQ